MKSAATGTIDAMMEQASQALARMSYLRCEALCEQALALAVEQARWRYAARILLPLQEARRQRRMIAADGVIRLGTSQVDRADAASWLDQWLTTHEAGCLAVDASTGLDVEAVRAEARRRELYVEVFTIESRDSKRWEISLASGTQHVSCQVPAPESSMLDQDAYDGLARAQASSWFQTALESLGDAALKQIEAEPSLAQRLVELQSRLTVVGDHELLHQQLNASMTEMQRVASQSVSSCSI